jgi:hypothetical protein
MDDKEKMTRIGPARNYQVEASLALEGDQFMGLAIDEDNEPELTPGASGRGSS